MNDTEPTRAARKRITARVGSVLFAILIVTAGVLLWPSKFGGMGTTAIVNGRSMDPTYTTGDLLYAWKGTPNVGNVVIYDPNNTGNRIVHRIIGGNATDGWILQGDNNDWHDPYRPTEDQVLGVVRVHIPGLGKAAAVSRSPIVWISVILVGAGLLLWPTTTPTPGRDHEDTPTPEVLDA